MGRLEAWNVRGMEGGEAGRFKGVCPFPLFPDTFGKGWRVQKVQRFSFRAECCRHDARHREYPLEVYQSDDPLWPCWPKAGQDLVMMMKKILNMMK